jgi:hypothetical protein
MSASNWAASWHDEPDIDLRGRARKRAIVTVAAAAALPFALSVPAAAAQALPAPWQDILQAAAATRAAKMEWLAPVASGRISYRVETAPK